MALTASSYTKNAIFLLFMLCYTFISLLEHSHTYRCAFENLSICSCYTCMQILLLTRMSYLYVSYFETTCTFTIAFTVTNTNITISFIECTMKSMFTHSKQRFGLCVCFIWQNKAQETEYESNGIIKAKEFVFPPTVQMNGEMFH